MAEKQPITLLISSLGLSRGLLYSALIQIPSTECLVIASAQSVTALEEIRQKAGYQGQIHTQIMQDPFTGFAEKKALLKEIKDILAKADDIVCNITGGTTAQQFIIQAIFEKAKRLKKKARRIALVDRRDVAEQRSNPYVVGELVELDREK